MEQKKIERKLIQENNLKRFQDAEYHLKKAINTTEGTDMMVGMIKERRKWITDLKAMGAKVPEDVRGFYEKVNNNEIGELVVTKKSDDAPKKKVDKKDKEKESKKQKKKADNSDDEKEASHKVNITEVVKKFDEQYDEFVETWADRDESKNFNQEYDIAMAKEELLPDIEAEYR